MAVLPPDPVFTLRNITMGPVHSLCFYLSNDYERLFAGTQDGSICTWNLKTNRQAGKILSGQNAIIAVNHIDDSLYAQEKGGNIKHWKPNDGVYSLYNTLETDYCGFCKFVLSETHNVLITPQRDGKMQIMNLDGELIQELMPKSDDKLGEIMCMKLLELSDCLYLLSAYESGDLFLWDLKAFKVLSAIKLRDFPLALDYDIFTGRGVIGNASENIQVFGIAKDFSMSLKCEIILKNPGVNSLKIRKDCKVFMSAGWDGRLRIYSWKSLRPLAALTEHSASLQDVCYSDKPLSLWKSPIMAAGGLDACISLWDIYK